MPEKTKCPPALWRKFTPEQRTWWVQFYNAFNNELIFPTPLDDKEHKQAREVIACNLSTVAIWELNGGIDK